MFIPKEFAIRGFIWRVEYKWNLTYNKQKVDGLTDPANKTILIERSLLPEEKFKTFLHEFQHSVLDSYGIGHNSPIKDRRLDYGHEDEIISRLEDELTSNFTIKWRKKR